MEMTIANATARADSLQQEVKPPGEKQICKERQQMKACHLLAAGLPPRLVAKEIGVSVATIYNWKGRLMRPVLMKPQKPPMVYAIPSLVA